MSANPEALKILHLSGTRLFSGAGRGVLWLHQGLRGLGVDSHVLSQEAPPDAEAGIYSLIGKDRPSWLKQRLLPRLDRLPLFRYPLKNKRLFSPGVLGNDLAEHPLVKAADIVHLHWINNGMLGVRNISALNKPLVWTVRDMWPFTGGCHYSLDCTKYTTGCGACPVLESAADPDLSSRRFAAKRSAFAALPIHWVPISPWMADCLRQSPIYHPAGHAVHQIMNCVNMDLFFPEDKHLARQRLGLPDDGRKLVLSGAINSANPYKGFGQYQRAMELLEAEGPDIHFVFFGRVDPAALAPLAGRYTALGYVEDDAYLRLAYAAADVFVAPSIQEAFGKTIVEAMACGTPVVCFNATGTGALVEHLVSGYAAPPFAPEGLAAGVRHICALSPAAYAAMATAAQQQAVERFSATAVAREYRTLYQQILSLT